ncbi:hypothetical protein [Roseomonas sp. BN140053]|uniref:hypothetical protein n=1 Tax=Roseomonas sp. BN140053 TaxID=3391898 RepID=UPI0039E76C76
MNALAHPPFPMRLPRARPPWAEATSAAAPDRGRRRRHARAGGAAFPLAVVGGELAWALVGSLALGLTGSGRPAPHAPWVWLGGAVAIAVLVPLARWLLLRGVD